MAISKIFNIVSHFKFEIGHAVAGSKKLGGNLDQLSSKLKGIEQQFKFLTIGAAVNITGGQAGVLGFFKSAIASSDKFRESQIQLGRIIEANGKKYQLFKGLDQAGKAITQNLAPGSSLEVARQQLNIVGEESRKGFFDPDEYLSIFKNMVADFSGAGLGGKNLENFHKITRGFLNSSDILGADPWTSRGQISRIIGDKQGGWADQQNTLFRLLSQKTPTMQGFQGTSGAQRWNKLKQADRFKKLGQALDELGGSSNIAEQRMSVLSESLRILKSYFTSFNSILKPLGDTFRELLVNVLKPLHKFVDVHLRKTFKDLGVVLKWVSGDLHNLYVQYEKLKTIGKSASQAHGLSIISFIFVALRKFIVPTLKFLLKSLTTVLGLTGVIISKTKIFALLPRVFKFLLVAMVSYAKWAAGWFVILRIWEGVKAKVKSNTIVDVAKNLGKLPAAIGLLFNILRKLAQPFISILDWISSMLSTGLTEFIAKMIKFISGETFKGWLEALNKAVDIAAHFFTGLGALVKTIFITLGNIFSGDIFKGKILNPIKVFQKTLDEDVSKLRLDSLKDLYKEFEEKTKTKSPIINQNNKITISNQFPENQEPDRIAISIKEVFRKASVAATGTASRSNLLQPGSAVKGL